MAGKHQHYLPRLLQRGFLHDPTERAERTWLHRQAARPRLVSIRDVGAEDYFYSRPAADGSRTLDDLITDLEGGLGADINRMRGADPGSPVDARFAARTVVHLVTRTAHIRSLFAWAMAALADGVADRLADPARLRAMLGLDDKTLPGMVHQALEEALGGLPLDRLDRLGIPRELARRMFVFTAREHADRLLAQQAGLLGPVFENLLDEVPGRIRDAHNEALGTARENNAWIDELGTYGWRIEAASGAVLSDSVALAVEGDGGFVPLLLSNRAAVRAVVMPLAAGRLLVGRRIPEAFFDEAEYNAGAAACSDDFFISATEAAGEGLAGLIGTRPGQILAEALGEAFSKDEGRGAADSAATRGDEIAIPSPAASPGFSFGVRCLDFGDEDLATKIASAIEAVVREIARDLPLHELDGLTFAVDYPEALRGLDRGSDALAPAATRALGYGEGVAKPVGVLRGGRPKTHLVLRSWIAVGLSATDREHRQTCIRLLVKMLATAAHATLYERTLGRPAPPDEVSRHLHAAVAPAPGNYFTARASAFIAPDMGGIYAELAVESLAHAKAEILRARLAYRRDGGLGRLLAVALPSVGAVLGHAADWLGHRDGLAEGSAFRGDDLPERLRRDGLDAWLELFGRDLRIIYEAPTGRLDPERLWALDRHVERLLWVFQICPWPTPDGGVFFSVPFGDDVALLVSEGQEG